MNRQVARVLAPAICGCYIAYVLWDRSAYHVARRAELDAASARARDQARRDVVARAGR